MSDAWNSFLRMSVETLTSLYLEAPSLQNWKNWSVDGHLDVHNDPEILSVPLPVITTIITRLIRTNVVTFIDSSADLF